MEDVFIGRQPIFDKQLKVAAYELLSRSNAEQNSAFIGEHNSNVATTRVILNALTEIGLDQLIGEHPAFINLTYDFLVSQHTIPDLRNQLVLEILEDVGVTQELLAAVKKLSDSGYMIALDDFSYNEVMLPLVNLADIVKLDVLQHDETSLRQHVARLANAKVKLLAEKVETPEQFALCAELGFDYFQGYFLCKPNIVQGQRAPSNRAALLHLLAQLQDPNVEISKLEELISQDVSLSYRLLRYINSAAFALRREVDSIRHAIIMLGMNTIRSLANLMLMSRVEDKPSELLTTAMVRAYMCEQLAQHFKGSDKDSLFTIGLLSVIDALLDQPMQQILSQLPLSNMIKDALLKQQGPLGEALQITLAFERGDWDEVHSHNIPNGVIQRAYLAAVQWSNTARQYVLN